MNGNTKYNKCIVHSTLRDVKTPYTERYKPLKRMIKNKLIFLAISLMIIGCSNSDEEEAKNEIISYQNIQLGVVNLQNSIGSYFSTATGKIINSGELNEINGPSIDIAYVGTLGVRLFEFPDSVDCWNLTEIPNAQTTDFINSMSKTI